MDQVGASPRPREPSGSAAGTAAAIGIGGGASVRTAQPSPARTCVCALAVLYCHQDATAEAMAGFGADEDGDEAMCGDVDGEMAAQAAALASQIEAATEGLPTAQRQALLWSAPRALPRASLGAACDLVMRLIASCVEAEAEVGRALSFADIRDAVVAGFPGQAHAAEDVCAALSSFLAGFDTPDDANVFFLQLRKLVGPSDAKDAGGADGISPLGSAIAPHAALGVFVRETCAWFELQSFEGVGRLHLALRAFARPGDAAMAPPPASAPMGGQGGAPWAAAESALASALSQRDALELCPADKAGQAGQMAAPRTPSGATRRAASRLPDVPLPSPPPVSHAEEDAAPDGSSWEVFHGLSIVQQPNGFLGLPDADVFGLRITSIHALVLIAAYLIIGWRAIFVGILLCKFQPQPPHDHHP